MIGRQGKQHRDPKGQSAFPTCTVFAVVGQHRHDPERLLLRGDDGRYYAYAGAGQPTAIEPAADWAIDPVPGGIRDAITDVRT